MLYLHSYQLEQPDPTLLDDCFGYMVVADDKDVLYCNDLFLKAVHVEKPATEIKQLTDLGDGFVENWTRLKQLHVMPFDASELNTALLFTIAMNESQFLVIAQPYHLMDNVSQDWIEFDFGESNLTQDFYLAFENMPLGIMVTEQNGNISFYNRYLKEHLGIPIEEVQYNISEWMKRLFPDLYYRDETYALLQQQLMTWHKAPLYFNPVHREIQHPNGEKLVIEMRYLEAGTSAVWAIDDVTQRVKQQHALEESKCAAESALHQLQVTQNELLAAEKLASLGSVVAGIAHELKTPIGNSRTIASHIAEKVRQMSHAIDNNQLRRSDLDQFIQDMNQSYELLSGALDRASDMVNSFNQSAADQVSGNRRPFNLDRFFEELMMIQKPCLKQQGVRTEIHCPQGLTFDSFPGPLHQVFTNLMDNSAKHAFTNMEQGCITIDVEDKDNTVLIHFQDNGAGIPQEFRDKVFEPFFTTKSGKGGSGLGMHIIQNILRESLGGTIQLCPSEIGVHFELSIPKRAPEDIAHYEISSAYKVKDKESDV